MPADKPEGESTQPSSTSPPQNETRTFFGGFVLQENGEWQHVSGEAGQMKRELENIDDVHVGLGNIRPTERKSVLSSLGRLGKKFKVRIWAETEPNRQSESKLRLERTEKSLSILEEVLEHKREFDSIKQSEEMKDKVKIQEKGQEADVQQIGKTYRVNPHPTGSNNSSLEVLIPKTIREIARVTRYTPLDISVDSKGRIIMEKVTKDELVEKQKKINTNI